MMVMASSCHGSPSAWTTGLGTRGSGESWGSDGGEENRVNPRHLLRADPRRRVRSAVPTRVLPRYYFISSLLTAGYLDSRGS